MLCRICDSELETIENLEHGKKIVKYICNNIKCDLYHIIQEEEDIVESASLNIIDVVDLIKKDIPRPQYIIDNLIIENSNCLIASPQKSYKSFLGVYMGVCIAMGWEFLGHKVKQCNVLYCDCESNPVLAKERLKSIESGLGKKIDRNKFIYDFTNYDLNDSGDLEKFKKTTKRHKIKVVFIDVLRGFLKNIRESSADEMREFQTTVMKPLRDEMGLTTISITHTRKTKQDITANIDKLENIRGSSEITNFSEIILSIERKGYENYAELSVLKNRYDQELEPFGIEFIFSKDSLILNKVDRELWLKERNTNYIKPMWLWILERPKETFTTKEFKAQLKLIGVDKGVDTVAKRVLDDLMVMGKVVKVKLGFYKRVAEKQSTIQRQ